MEPEPTNRDILEAIARLQEATELRITEAVFDLAGTTDRGLANVKQEIIEHVDARLSATDARLSGIDSRLARLDRLTTRVEALEDRPA